VATGGMRPEMDHEPDEFGVAGLVGWIFAAAAFAACSVLVAVLAPGPLLAAARRAEESPGWSLFFGVVSVPAVVVLCVVLAVSIVGIPVLLLLAPAYLAFVFFGALVAAYFVGRRVVFATGRYHAGNALAAVVGALIVAAVYLIPVLGGLLLYVLALFGVGASILALFSRRRPRTTYTSYEDYVQNQRDA
jgi:MFS family permease